MDLSKAFNTLPHDLIVEKFKAYGADDKTVELIQDYLTNPRRQQVKLGDQFSTWQGISAGIPQGSVPGPLIFNIFMNDLVHCHQTQQFVCLCRWHADNFSRQRAPTENWRDHQHWPRSCRHMVRGKWYEEKPSKVPSNRDGKDAHQASVLLRKHRNPHYRRRFWNAWSNCRRQTEIWQACSQSMQKSLSASCRTQAYEDATIWNKKEHLFCIYHSPFQLLLRNLALLQ